MPRCKQAQTVHNMAITPMMCAVRMAAESTAATDREYTLIWNTH